LSPIPRLPALDLPWAEGVEKFCAEAGAELARELAVPESGGQIEHVLLATYLEDLGLIRYALGFSLEDVKETFQLAARALLRVFKLRGTEPDDSLANSRRGREALLLALAAEDLALARSLAPHVEDPEGASYLGPDSVVTTPDDQALAKAWRDLVLGLPVPPLSLGPDATPGALLEAAALEPRAAGDAASFSTALARLLLWHEEQATLEEHRHQPDWLLCLPGLALETVAVERGVVGRGETLTP